MSLSRRRFFLVSMGALVSAATGELRAIAQSVWPALSGSKVAAVTGVSPSGIVVRTQVFENIVRKALAGAEWRQLCASVMRVNQISVDEVRIEVVRRKASEAAVLSAGHPSHPGYLYGCSGCCADRKRGRAMLLQNGDFKWVS